MLVRFLAATVLVIVVVIAAGWFLLTPPKAWGACRSVTASWYGAFHHGRTTANGERFDQNALTAAHKTMRFGTRLRVSRGDRSVVVRVNDRGPYIAGRDLDLAREPARRLGMLSAGVAKVCITKLN
jgi:rare lipoprotein A